MLSTRLLRALRPVFIAAACAMATAPCAAQESVAAYPNKPVRIVVPFPAGGVVDAVARMVSADLAKAFGQPVIVDNRAGANGSIGSAEVARATPDGHTLLMVFDAHATSHLLVKNLPYDTFNAFTPITLMATTPMVLLAGAQSPLRSVEDVLARSRQKPGGLSFGTVGPGSTNHLTAALLARRAGVEMMPVPYKGGGPMITDLVGGQIDLAFLTIGNSRQLVASGKLRPLAVAAGARHPFYPQVPALSESVPGVESVVWVGMLGPAHMPVELVARIHRLVTGVLGQPAIRKRLQDQGYTVEASRPEEFDRRIRSDAVQWGRLIRSLNIQAE